MDDILVDVTPAEIAIVEGGFYERNDGATLAVTKLLNNAVKFVVLGAPEPEPPATPAKKTKVVAGRRKAARGTATPTNEQKLTLKQFRAIVVGVADVPLPIVGELYRKPFEGMIDDYELDAVRVTSISDGHVMLAQATKYGDPGEARWSLKQGIQIAEFVAKYTERVYEPKRMPKIVDGGVYRDHDGAIIEVLRLEDPAKKKPARSSASLADVLVVFKVNGGDYEYRECPKILIEAIAATLDRSALTSEAIAEADYKGQVTSALARFTRAEEHMAAAAEQKKAVDDVVRAAAEERKIALAGLTQIGNGQAMLPGVHAALAGSD